MKKQIKLPSEMSKSEKKSYYAKRRGPAVPANQIHKSAKDMTAKMSEMKLGKRWKHGETKMSKKAVLLWIDLEMTGLEPENDKILEVAAIATDWDFNEIARYQTAIKVDMSVIKSRMVGDFWERNKKTKKALIGNSLEGKGIKDVEKDLLKIVNKYFGKEIYLAGNSIHQDRKFIEREMPKLDVKLHYRMLDVSAWKIVFADKFKDEFKKPEHHRAEKDIEGSISELKYYLTKIKNEKP